MKRYIIPLLILSLFLLVGQPVMATELKSVYQLLAVKGDRDYLTYRPVTHQYAYQLVNEDLESIEVRGKYVLEIPDWAIIVSFKNTLMFATHGNYTEALKVNLYFTPDDVYINITQVRMYPDSRTEQVIDYASASVSKTVVVVGRRPYADPPAFNSYAILGFRYYIRISYDTGWNTTVYIWPLNISVNEVVINKVFSLGDDRPVMVAFGTGWNNIFMTRNGLYYELSELVLSDILKWVDTTVPERLSIVHEIEFLRINNKEYNLLVSTTGEEQFRAFLLIMASPVLALPFLLPYDRRYTSVIPTLILSIVTSYVMDVPILVSFMLYFLALVIIFFEDWGVGGDGE